jgi:hypothetical protein
VLYEPFKREEERAEARRRAEETLRLMPPLSQRTEEEQRQVNDQVRAWRRSQGIPETGLTRRGTQARALQPINSERMRGVLADCEARRARREQHGGQIPVSEFSRNVHRGHPAPGLVARLKAVVCARLGLSTSTAGERAMMGAVAVRGRLGA